MTSVAWRPNLIKKLFDSNRVSQAGIYTVKLYIRGKPWLIQIDDEMLFEKGNNPQNLRFAKFDPKSNSLWAPLLEKAFAKVKGNYYNTIAGIPENSLRILTGAPLFHYQVEKLHNDSIWDYIKSGFDSEYLMTAGTNGFQNPCGISSVHAYSILAAFFLRDGDEVKYKMLMVRDPKGTNTYSGKWNDKDSLSWSPSYIKQVPYGINPLRKKSNGVFFIEIGRFGICFDSFQIAH